MATFEQRGKKNNWTYRIYDGTINPANNKPNQIRVSKSKEFPKGFRTLKDAKSAASTHEHELHRGTHIREKEMLFRELSDDWLTTYANTVKVSTVRVRKHESGRLIEHLGAYRAKDITKKMYQDVLNKLKRQGLSDSTIEGIHTTGRMIFGYAIEFDIISVNPTQFAKAPKTKKTVEQLESESEVVKYLEKEDLSTFLKEAKEQGIDGDYLIFLLLSYSGMRTGELCALKWSDFNEKDLTLSITKTYYNPTNNMLKYELLTPKTNTSKRKIELSPIIFDELKNHRSAQNEFKMQYRKTYHNKDFVFVNKDKYPGYPIYIKRIESRMARLLKLSGLNTSLTPHSLRHTHTSLLAEAGVGLQEIMERLGHKDDETTKSVYLHVTKSMKKEASHKFENLMKNL